GLRRIKQTRNEVRSLSIDLFEWRVVTKAHAVVDREAPVQLPLVSRIPLHLRQTKIRKRTRCRLLVIPEVANQRVGISVTRVAERDRVVAVVTGEVEHARPLTTWRFTVLQPFEVNAKFE